MTNVQDQWSTVKPLLGALPAWIADEQEKQRIAAYALYEAMYWGNPGAFKLSWRGSEDKSIYVPSGRVIVETLNRYLAAKVDFVVDPLFGTPQAQLLATQVMTDLKRRERLLSRFNSNKRYGIIRGDWMFHIFADPLREPGAKISIFGVDPASVFPIWNPNNVDEVIGYHIAEMTLDSEGTQRIRRTTYRKQTGMGGPSPIDVTDELYPVDKWGGPGMDAEDPSVEVITPPQTLPSPIDQLPIYHIQNFAEPGSIFGSSEMRGLERLMAAINQGISDEELTLALDGLGVYATDAGTPVNDEGEEIGWNLGPGRVVELPEGKIMTRISGTASVAPVQEHLAYLHAVMEEAVGVNGAAKGKVDVTVAESGIALLLELAPLLAVVEEKEQIVTDVMTNMLFDLPKWFVAYEGGSFNSLMNETRWIPAYGDKIPQNRAAEVTELMGLAAAQPQIVPMSYVRQRLRLLGFDDLPTEEEVQALILAEQDAQGARVAAEVDAALAAGEAEGADLSGAE